MKLHYRFMAERDEAIFIENTMLKESNSLEKSPNVLNNYLITKGFSAKFGGIIFVDQLILTIFNSF